MKIGIIVFVLSVQIILSAIRGFNDTEAESCKSVVPSRPEDCLNQKYSTLNCCFVALITPYHGSLCVAMSQTTIGTQGSYNTTLPNKMNFQGVYTCYAIFKRVSIALLSYILIL